MSIRRRLVGTVAAFGTLTAAAILLAPLIGATHINLGAVLDRHAPFADNLDAQIFFIARLPRVLAAALVGSSLALSGVVFQALLRNPLASPDTLGVSAGASLGAMLAITFHADFRSLGSPRSLSPARLGALAIVYGCRRRDAAARPRWCCPRGRHAEATLRGHPVRAKTPPISPNVSDDAVDDGVAGRRVARRCSRRSCRWCRVGGFRHARRASST
jgi:hypothetical protein